MSFCQSRGGDVLTLVAVAVGLLPPRYVPPVVIAEKGGHIQYVHTYKYYVYKSQAP